MSDGARQADSRGRRGTPRRSQATDCYKRRGSAQATDRYEADEKNGAAPYYAEPLIGWRVWCVVETSAGLRLASVIHDDVWPIGTELVARCHLNEHHDAPHAGCSCGIYAAREPAAVWSYLSGRDEPWTVARVLGRVLLWGAVVEHERGWRASHAYPLDLVGADALARSVIAPVTA